MHMGDVRYVDQSGVYMLADLVEDLHKNDTSVFIAEMLPEPVDVMKRLGIAPGVVAPERIFDRVEDAIISAITHGWPHLEPPPEPVESPVKEVVASSVRPASDAKKM